MPRFTVLRKAISEFSDDDCPTMAAALAYYTVFSLPSILLIVVFVAGSVLGQGAVQGSAQNVGQAIGGSGGSSQISGMLANARRSTSGGIIATAFGIAGLIFSATTALVQLQTSLNRAWDVKADPNAGGVRTFLWKRIYSFGLIVGVGILILASLTLSSLLQKFGNLLPMPDFVAVLGEALVTLALLTFLFGAIFKVLPDAEIAWHDVWYGAFFTAILFMIGKYLVSLYLSHSSIASGYGAAGSLAILLLWTYYSSMSFLLGAEFTQVWARREGKEIQPSQGAVRIIQREKRPDELRPAA